jgi:hypothetical protein
MNPRTCVGIVRGLLLTALICWGASLGLAQTKTVSPAKSPVEAQKQIPPAPAHKWIKDPNQLMPMRQMTNAQRRAAAERARTRRAKAEAQRRLQKQNSQSGVQQ